MKLLEKINIDLLEFVRTGQFDFLVIGKTIEWVSNNFPDPDSIGLTKTHNSDIWYYGDIELHFKDEILTLIYTENPRDVDGGNSLQIQNILQNSTETFDLSSVLKKLNKERIDYVKRTEKHIEEYIRVTIINSGVTLTFIENEANNKDPNQYTLSAISLSSKTPS